MAKLTIIFVIDKKRLEAMALLLIASLRKHHPVGGSVDIVAYATGSSIRAFAETSQAFFEEQSVSIRELGTHAGFWKKPYPHGNKIFACAQSSDLGPCVFLDTDTICMQPLDTLSLDQSHSISVVPEGRATWGKDMDRWVRAYRFFGLEVPEERVTLTRGKRLRFPPYFNAGFIGFNTEIIAGEATFAQLWLKTAQEFDWGCAIGQKRPWLDQITLPLTLARYGVGYSALGDRYNYSVSKRKSFKHTEDAVILHYHRSLFLKALPQYPGIVSQLFDICSPEQVIAFRQLLIENDLL